MFSMRFCIIKRAIIPLAFLAKNDIMRGLPFLISLNTGVTISAFKSWLSMELKYSTDAQLIIVLVLWPFSSLESDFESLLPQNS